MALAGIDLRGSEGLDRALAALGARAPHAAGGALFREATRILGESKKLVPVDTGALRASGHVQLPAINGTRVTVTLGYGTKYALPVHEIPPPPAKSAGGRSARHRPPTGWKYLERPVLEAQSGMADRIAADLRPALERPV